MTVVANILDPVHDTLDPTVWDAVHEHTPVLKPQHKTWILDTIHDTLKAHGYGDMDKWLEVYATGSLTTFQYSPESDCDVSLFVNTDVFPEWSRAEMVSVMVDNVDGILLPGTTHPMQVFVVNHGIRPHDLYKPGLRSGYLIERDQWMVPPERERSHDVQKEQAADYQYALECADKMERLIRYEPDSAKRYWHQIHERRRRDHQLGKGDFSQSNIIYKFLSNRGLFPKIEELTGEHIASIDDDPMFNPLPKHVNDHWLTWRPGMEGKGFILENGRVWTWPTQNLRPMHLNRAAAVKSLGGKIRPETAFHIDPEGNVFQVGPGRHLDHINQGRLYMADRRLKVTQAPAGAEGFGHAREIYEKLKMGKEAAFFNDEQEPTPELLEEFGPEWDLQRQRRNELRAMPHVMYHVAPTGRREHIMQNGLVPDAARINEHSHHDPGVYLWEDPEVAMKYRGQGPNQYSDFDLYAVHAPREHLKPDPWFEHNHQDRAADFPGAWYSPNAISPEHVHPFYDSPWHPRTAGAPEPWSVNHEAVERARQHLGLRLPVEISMVKGTHGQYLGGHDGKHYINLVDWLKPESASKQLWHELTHAAQYERDPVSWDAQNEQYGMLYTQGHESYRNHPWEVEARQTADAHAFPLVHGIRQTTAGSEWDMAEFTMKGQNEQKAEEQPVISASAP